MVMFREITEVKERKPVYTDRFVVLPRLTTAPFGTPEHEAWVMNNWWMANYRVFMDDKPEAVRLANELSKVFKRNPDDPLIGEILKKLRMLELKPYETLSPIEKWTRGAFQYVDYTGGYDVHALISRRLNKYSGAVLEAMCGHMSYFKESPDRTVTALDYCTESLKKYPVPSRRRIECDLNQIRGDVKLQFFNEGEFDAISICFGFKYLADICLLAKEFRRILKPDGVLSFVENPKSGYEDLYHRNFDRNGAREVLMKSGFRTVTIRAIPIPQSVWQKERGNFYHTEAVK